MSYFCVGWGSGHVSVFCMGVSCSPSTMCFSRVYCYCWHVYFLFLLVFYVDTILLVTEPCVLELGIEIPPALFFLL